MPFRVRPRLPADQVLAERESVAAGFDPPERIVVRIGFPRRSSGGRYVCIAEFEDGEEISVKPMNGVDALEAVQLALMMTGTLLQHRSGYSPGGLSWLGGERLDLGMVTPEWMGEGEAQTSR
ncbi:MAG: DUF6968 family protein [Bryobacteraceae bacterium]